jgi:ribosome maturation factor RimP
LPEDFRRFSGGMVKLQTREAIAGNRHWQGRLRDVKDDGFTLDIAGVKQKSGGGKMAGTRKAAQSSVAVEFKNVEKANLVPEI